MNLINEAQQFAHEAHDAIEQKRKYTYQPYWVHTDAVAALVASVGGSSAMIAAAHLHDYREDVVTKLTEDNRLDDLAAFEARYNAFPLEVRELVTALTDVYTKEAYPHMNRATRKNLERERIGKTPVDAKTIKLADLINNTESIVSNDRDFARVYLTEKLAILPYLAEGNGALLNQAAVQTVAGCAAVGIDIPYIVGT